MNNLLKRVSNQVLNKKVFEALIFSNSLKSLNKNQKLLIQNLDKILLYNSNYHKNFNENQSSLFPDSDNIEENIKDDGSKWDINEKLEKEIEAFGFYLSEHPTKIFKKIYSHKNISDLEELNTANIKYKSTFTQTFIVLLNTINERKSKRGKRFCFFKCQ